MPSVACPRILMPHNDRGNRAAASDFEFRTRAQPPFPIGLVALFGEDIVHSLNLNGRDFLPIPPVGL
jgi:hypothetical protein